MTGQKYLLNLILDKMEKTFFVPLSDNPPIPESVEIEVMNYLNEIKFMREKNKLTLGDIEKIQFYLATIFEADITFLEGLKI